MNRIVNKERQATWTILGLLFFGATLFPAQFILVRRVVDREAAKVEGGLSFIREEWPRGYLDPESGWKTVRGGRDWWTFTPAERKRREAAHKDWVKRSNDSDYDRKVRNKWNLRFSTEPVVHAEYAFDDHLNHHIVGVYAKNRRDLRRHCYEGMARLMAREPEGPEDKENAMTIRVDVEKESRIGYEGQWERRYKTCEDLPRKSIPCGRRTPGCWLVYYSDEFK